MSNGIVDLDRDLFNSIQGELEACSTDVSSVSEIISSGLSCLSGELASSVSGGTVNSTLTNISNDYVVVSNAITSAISQYDQTEANNQFDMSMFEEGVESTFSQVETSITEGANLSLEERLAMLNQTINTWAAIKSELEAEFEENFGKGIYFQDYEALKDLKAIFSILDIKGLLNVGHLEFIHSNNKGYLDLEFTGRIVDVVREYDLFSKLKAYVNGSSWEECGFAEIYGNDPYTEKSMLFRMYQVIHQAKDFNVYCPSANEVDPEFIKGKFKEFYHIDDTYFPMDDSKKWFDAIASKVDEARELQMNINSISSQVYGLKQLVKILPYTHVMENADFSNYLSRDYANDKSIPDRLKENLSQEELAVYVYIIDHDGKTKADAYISAMEDLINQRIGMRKAAEYIESMAANGFDIGDVFTSGGTGFIDGVRNFFKGIGNFFNPDGVISASDYEMMFKVSLLAQGENEFNKNLTAAEREFLSFNYQTWQSIGNMIIPSAVAFIPVVGKPLSSALLFLSIAGNNVESAMQQGEVGWKSYLYGCLTGVSEVVFERLMGGIPGLSNLSGSFIRNMVGEGMEEFFQEWVDAGLRFAIFGDPINVTETMSNSAYAFLQGMVVSGIMQAGTNLAFKIGNEVVYWNSDIPYNSLTEMLAHAQGKGDAVSLNMILSLFNKEGSSYEKIRQHFVESYMEKYNVDGKIAARMVDLVAQTYDAQAVNKRMGELFKFSTSSKQLSTTARESRVVTIDGKTIITNLTDAEIVKFVNDNDKGKKKIYYSIDEIDLSTGIGIPMNAEFVAAVTDKHGNVKYRIIWPEADGYTVDPKTGKANMTKTTLTKGMVFDRYGNEYGSYVSPMQNNEDGTLSGYSFDERALPYDPSQTYNQYEVICNSLDAATITQAIKDNYSGGIEQFIKDYPDYWSGDAKTGQFTGDTYTGTIAPWFGAPGGGTQIQLPISIKVLLKLKLIRQI